MEMESPIKNRAVVRSFPGATTEDFKDFIKPLSKKKPNAMILHVGTNDIGKVSVNTFENLAIMLAEVKNQSPNTNVIISGICTRNDKPNVSKSVVELNKKLKDFCIANNVGMIYQYFH